MKKENWIKNLNLADDKFLAEANPDTKIRNVNKKRIV